jgi:8-oxo-dGTP diphosphatase
MNVRPSAIIKQDQSVLTLRYRYGDTDVYALPGGNPDPGECLSEALARELMEELGVRASLKGMAFCGEVVWQEMQKETLHIVFAAEIYNQTPALNPAHTTALEIVWLPLAEVESKIMYPNVGKQIARYCCHESVPGHIGLINQPYIR